MIATWGDRLLLRHSVIVRTFEGDIIRGFVGFGIAEGDPRFPGRELFAAAEGDGRLNTELDRAKTIYLMRDKEDTMEQVVRFFDAARTPSTLWVRISFCDGDVMEGAIQNSLDSFSAPFLELQPLDHKAARQRVWVPRAAITGLQVINVRE